MENSLKFFTDNHGSVNFSGLTFENGNTYQVYFYGVCIFGGTNMDLSFKLTDINIIRQLLTIIQKENEGYCFILRTENNPDFKAPRIRIYCNNFLVNSLSYSFNEKKLDRLDIDGSHVYKSSISNDDIII